MATIPWSKLREEMRDHDEEIARERDEVLREHVAFTLAELRSIQHITQSEIAARLTVAQPSISKLEGRNVDAAQIATVRAYVEALGGQLDIAAVFDGERMPLAL